MPDAIVLAIHAEHADAILDGTARFEHRTLPPKRLPARAYLCVWHLGLSVRAKPKCQNGADARLARRFGQR
jgi:hypothetical protein